MTAHRGQGFAVLAKTAGLAALAALVLACTGDPEKTRTGPGPGDDSNVPVPPPEDPGVTPPPDDGGEPPAPAPEPCASIVLRLRGVDAGGATEYALDLAAVEVSGDGGPVDVTSPRTGAVDLLRPDHAWDLGTVVMPDCPQRLRAVIRLAGGTVTLPSGDVLFDPLSPPIAFPIDTGSVAPGRCHVVVHLDLAGSLGAQGSGALPFVFLPRFSVHY